MAKRKYSPTGQDILQTPPPVTTPAPIMSNSSAGIRFNPDKTTTVSLKNPEGSTSTQQLSKSQFKEFNQAQGLSPNTPISDQIVRNLVLKQRSNMDTLKSLRLLQQQNQQEANLKKVLGLEEPSASQALGVTSESLKASAAAKMPTANDPAALDTFYAAGIDPLKAPMATGNVLSDATNLLSFGTGTAFNLVDNFRAFVGVGGRDTSYVKGVKDSFALITTQIDMDIEAVRNGQMNQSEALSNFDKAYSANLELERTAKKKGLANAAYWLKEGKDLEVFANTNEKRLQQQLIDLQRAADERRAAEVEQRNQQALAQFGVND